MNVWLQFFLCAGAIFYAGSKLTHIADDISERTGLGRSWIGLILLATITSLPELITGISAVRLNDLPDMAISGTLGSCVFNLLVIALLDLLSKELPVSRVVHQGHLLSAGFGILMAGLVAIDILFGKYLPLVTWPVKVSVLNLTCMALYLLAMRLIYSFEQNKARELTGEEANQGHVEAAKQPLIRLVLAFILHALLIVAAACYLPSIGEQIVKSTGWGETFIGASFIAITTSLPEITVSVAAARLMAFDMAVANLLGSNLFNILIVGILDVLYVKAPILGSVSSTNALMALTAIVSTSIAVLGLTFRSERKFFLLAGDALAILIVSILSNILLFIAKE